MSELLERELSRVLHDMPGEATPQPTLYAEINRRARQIRRRRYSSGALLAAVAVSIAAAVPAVLLGNRNHAAPPAVPAGPSKPLTAWPARGALVHDATTRANATDAWNRALIAAGRGRLTHPVHELYADRVPGVGLVIVLTGVEPRGGDRTVILSGPTAAHLSVYVDDVGSPFQMISVLFGGTGEDSAEPRTRCTVDSSAPADTRTLFVLTDPAATQARWQGEVSQPAYDCRNAKPGRWSSIPFADGVGSTAVRQHAGERIDVEVDGPGAAGYGSSVRYPGALPVEMLSGGRVAGAVPIAWFDPVAPAQPQTTCSNGRCVSTLHAEAHAQRRSANGPDNPWGWGERKDVSGGVDLYFKLEQLHPEDLRGGDQSGQQISLIGLALPDGTPIGGSFLRNGSGPTRFDLAASPEDATDVYVDRIVTRNQSAPKELSAVVRGRNGNRWLFVAGAPGVASIDYRAHGSSHWQSMDVYESSGYLPLPKSDKGTGTIRLRTTDGTTVYQGKVDALHAL